MSKIIIDASDIAGWLDGMDILFKLPKDDRPDFNPYEYFDNCHQGLYKLTEMAHQFPLNKVPPEIVDGIEIAEKLAEICEKYEKHLFGLLLSKKIKTL